MDYSVNSGPFLRLSMRFELLSEIQGPELDNIVEFKHIKYLKAFDFCIYSRYLTLLSLISVGKRRISALIMKLFGEWSSYIREKESIISDKMMI